MSRKQLEDLCQEIFNTFSPNIECNTQDMCYGHEEDCGDYDIGDDYENDDYHCDFVVTGLTHDQVKERLVTILGEVQELVSRSDGITVNNWWVGKGKNLKKVHIVHLDDSISLSYHYTKG